MSDLPYPCQGGWCIVREACRHYNSPRQDVMPWDRICERGDDGGTVAHLVWRTPADAWPKANAALMAKATWCDLGVSA